MKTTRRILHWGAICDTLVKILIEHNKCVQRYIVRMSKHQSLTYQHFWKQKNQSISPTVLLFLSFNNYSNPFFQIFYTRVWYGKLSGICKQFPSNYYKVFELYKGCLNHGIIHFVLQTMVPLVSVRSSSPFLVKRTNKIEPGSRKNSRF